MSRQQFTNRNNINSVLTFQKSGATASFDPSIIFSFGSRRVSWKLDNGSSVTQTAGNSIVYSGFTSDSAIRTIEMRGNSFTNINNIDLQNDNIFGHIDLRPLKTFTNSSSIFLSTNPNLTGVTNPNTSNTFNNYQITNSGLVGNLDMTPLSGLGGNFQVQGNPNLTGITHSPSSNNFSVYFVNNCNLTGNLDLSLLFGLGGDFRFNNNSNLTSVTHPSSINTFSVYQGNNCNLTGNLDLTPLSGLGGQFIVNSNPNLTGITNPITNNNIIAYQASSCGLIGTLDLSPLQKLGGSSVNSFGIVRLHNNNLTNIIFPNSTQFFRNLSDLSQFRAFSLQSCNLDYVDFTPLSGATMVSGSTQGRATIELQNNNTSAADVNHILVDFETIATNNHPRWSEVTLNIGGTNDDPDSSSGGYDGLAAIATLTGSPYNWIIST
jgi:hypothetical protein